MKNSKLSVLFVAAEMSPIAKVGGLADVVSALPKALVESGVDVSTALPFYNFLKELPEIKISKSFKVSIVFSGKTEEVVVSQAKLRGYSPVLWLFDFENLAPHEVYGSATMKNGLYENPLNDLEKFTKFSLAVSCAIVANKISASIVHVHDWHTALIPFLLKKTKVKTILTIHNLANQGLIDQLLVKWLGSESPEFKHNSQYNLLALGIEHADLVTTVSEKYSQEILTKQYGCGLEKLLKKHKYKLSGIVNGIDNEIFDPSKDKLIDKKFDLANIAKKTSNKTLLQRQLGLKIDPTMPLIGLVSRFVEQKGLDLVDENTAKLNAQYVFLGEGQKNIEDQLEMLTISYPDKFKVIKGFDLSLAQKIYAASDFFLMPSKFEPCGLGQLIAMRYGSLPIVRETGGLADTVSPAVGFSFKTPSANVLRKTIMEALTVFYAQPKKFSSMQKAAMKRDYSWKKSVLKYIKIYNKLTKISK